MSAGEKLELKSWWCHQSDIMLYSKYFEIKTGACMVKLRQLACLCTRVIVPSFAPAWARIEKDPTNVLMKDTILLTPLSQN